MSTVVLVRHGETAWNRDRRVQGWAPVPLTDRGREQAAAAADHLAASFDVDRIVASDLRRTVETTRFVRRRFPEAAVAFDRRWRERSFGVYQGFNYEDLFEGYPQFALGESGYAAARETPEGGESLLTVRDRVLDAWDDLLADLGGETAVVVTHGGPIHLVVGELRGLDVVSAIVDVTLDNCGVTEVVVEGDAPRLASENETSFLE